MFDTHTHLQFKAFEKNVDEVIQSAKKAGVEKMIVVGTNLETSKNAIALAQKHEGLYASIGLHPHHIFSYCHPELDSGSSQTPQTQLEEVILNLESLISNHKVIAIGETGLDRHIYQKTHYQDYEISEEFINLQKQFFIAQIKLAIKHQKSLIIHNRKATDELLEILAQNWDPFLENHSVFHCVEPDKKILDFALKHKVFIGIDGDITYDKDKQKFIKMVPLENLVLETDSPYFLPKTKELKAALLNEPKNLATIAEQIALLKQVTLEKLVDTTTTNSYLLYRLKA